MTDDIRIAEEHPRYWECDGELTVLLGGSSEDNLFQISELESELDTLTAAGGNYVRNTMSSRESFAVWPFEEVEPGLYDLEFWNEEYWDRFESLLAATAERDIVCQIELWATWDFYRGAWRANPFNPACNVTYTATESGLEENIGDLKPHEKGAYNDFFYSIPSEQDLEVVRKYQDRYVAKLLEHSLEYNNVLYCIDNETDVTREWSDYWARFIKEKATTRGVEAFVTEMWLETDITDEQHETVVEKTQLYDFFEGSQNSSMIRDKHWDNFQYVYNNLAVEPRPINHIKTYGGRTHWTDGPDQGIERFWRNLIGGAASIRFHRPDAGNGLSPRAQRHIESARMFVDAFDIARATPDTNHELLSERDPNEAFCCHVTDEQYAVYFPDGGSVEIDLPANEAGWEVRWLSVEDCKWFDSDPEPLDGTPLTVETWALGHWVALVNRA